jgi:hypothetical protein
MDLSSSSLITKSLFMLTSHFNCNSFCNFQTQPKIIQEGYLSLLGTSIGEKRCKVLNLLLLQGPPKILQNQYELDHFIM